MRKRIVQSAGGVIALEHRSAQKGDGPCLSALKAVLYGFRVIFKATFEINLPPGGFLQKDFPLDFYLAFCTLPSASSGKTLRNCFQIHHLIPCRTLVEAFPDLCLTDLHL